MYLPNYNPKILYAIGTKRHFKRFYLETLENLKPGTVISEKFTRPEKNNFLMQSHYPIKVSLLKYLLKFLRVYQN